MDGSPFSQVLRSAFKAEPLDIVHPFLYCLANVWR